MILSIAPELFDSDDDRLLRTISQIFDHFFEGRFIWDIQNIDMIFLDRDIEETKFFKRHLSEYNKEYLQLLIREILEKAAYQTETHNKYLTKIIIGNAPTEVTPEVGLQILTCPSLLIVENANNDWKFFTGLLNKYLTQKGRKTIYSLIKDAVDKYWLKPENAGGIGMISHRIADLSNGMYKDIERYKLMTIFDSDRNEINAFSNEQRKLIEYIKGGVVIESLEQAIHVEDDLVLWHMLYKRAIENYIPIHILKSNFRDCNELFEKIEGLSSQELDFYKYEENAFRKKNVNIKQEFPPIFDLDWNRSEVESRCKHHLVAIELPNGSLENVCEIEEILLRIAKVI